MNEPIPILESVPLDPGDRRLIALFDALEAGQLDFLDKASKRIIDLCTAMLGLLFAVTAFGEKFPPAYLAQNDLGKGLVLAVLAAYLLALLFALLAIQPRTYERPEHDLTRMRQELDRIVSFKRRWFRVATALFFADSLALAALVGTILLRA
jgi:hypothetical protein